nr:staphylococcal-like nuclease CAN2 [Tanacetum cinerariifolium]
MGYVLRLLYSECCSKPNTSDGGWVNQQQSHGYHGGVTSSAGVSAIARDIHHFKKTSQSHRSYWARFVRNSKIFPMLLWNSSMRCKPRPLIITYGILFDGMCNNSQCYDALTLSFTGKQWIDERHRIEATYEGIYGGDSMICQKGLFDKAKELFKKNGREWSPKANTFSS